MQQQLILTDEWFNSRLIKIEDMQCIQNNKQFYNYTLYDCSVFNKYSLDNYEYNTTHITNDIYNGNIPFLIFGGCYPYNI